ncbi:MAG: HAD family hydrolase [Raoultibacter sp.]
MTYDFDTFVFDLDGTVLNTLPDLVVLTNRTLTTMGFPERSEAEILSFVGNGARRLIYQAVPSDTSEEVAEDALTLWKSLYGDCGVALTREYEGMTAVLEALKARGKTLGLLSNKFDEGVQDLMKIHFPGVFDVAHGEGVIPRKPDPAGLLQTITELGSTPARTVYVGDSRGDMVVANRANAFALGVAWGYQSEADLMAGGADVIIHQPEELLAFA